MSDDKDIEKTEGSDVEEETIVGHEESSIFDDAKEDQALGLEAIVDSKMIFYERLPMLEVVSDRLIRLLSASLRNFTSENVSVSFASLTSVRFGDYLKSIKNPCLINVFFANDWGGAWFSCN